MSKLPPGKPPRPKPVDKAFDVWLDRSLRELYGEIAKESVPDELLKLIEQDRAK